MHLYCCAPDLFQTSIRSVYFSSMNPSFQCFSHPQTNSTVLYIFKFQLSGRVLSKCNCTGDRKAIYHWSLPQAGNFVKRIIRSCMQTEWSHEQTEKKKRSFDMDGWTNVEPSKWSTIIKKKYIFFTHILYIHCMHIRFKWKILFFFFASLIFSLSANPH